MRTHFHAYKMRHHVGISPRRRYGNIACGDCSYCVRANKNWNKFLQEVDDVVNLAQVNPSIISGLGISPKQVNTKQELDKVFHRLITKGWEEETDGKDMLNNLRSHINVCAICPSTDAGNGYFFSEYSPQDLRKEQEQDPDLKVLIEWLNTGNSPSEADTLLCSPAAKNYWINKDMFGKDNNGIVIKTLFTDKSPIKVW